MNSDTATIVYSYFFVFAAIGAGVGFFIRHYVKEQQAELKTELGDVKEQLTKIMYALYNDGKTGLINKVDCLIERQQEIKIDVEVIKASRRKRATHGEG